MTERTRRIIELLDRIDYRNQTPQRLAEAIAEVDGLPQSPNVSEALDWLINCVECEVNIRRTTTVFQLRLAQAKETLALTRPDRKCK